MGGLTATPTSSGGNLGSRLLLCGALFLAVGRWQLHCLFWRMSEPGRAEIAPNAPDNYVLSVSKRALVSATLVPHLRGQDSITGAVAGHQLTTCRRQRCVRDGDG